MAAATLKLFLVYGDPKRLRTAELSNWTGKAVSGPRSEFDLVLKRDESLGSGVYFLTGFDPQTGEKAIYIGEAECIRDRIRKHLTKDFWNTVTFFVSKDESLTKAHVRYLEGRLIALAQAARRVEVKNGQSSGARLPESDREDMEVFLSKMRQVMPVVGIEAFIDPVASTAGRKTARALLTCTIKGLTATGYLTPDGMVVLKGSQAVRNDRPSAHKYPTVLAQRRALLAKGELVVAGEALVFQNDVEFSSPSAAAAVIHGGSANGLTAWCNADGIPIKELELT